MSAPPATPTSPPLTLASRRVVGSSILPYAIDETFGNVYFLLGKEQVVENWTGSEKWSDFGGAAHSRESPPYTAAREFTEESCANVRIYAAEPMPRQSFVPLAMALQNEEYTFKLETPVGREGVYITYVMQIPLQPEATEVVEHARAALLAYRAEPSAARLARLQELQQHEHPAINGKGEVNVDYLEKSTVRFWSAIQLRRACANMGAIQYRNRSAPPSASHEQLRSTFRHRLRLVLSEFPNDVRGAPTFGDAEGGAFKRPERICFDTYNNSYPTPITPPCP